ncbi:MAG TPA: GNAT family N-acetyltransferase [Candidatus Kapabacteria bacterium]|nr:GNAT family N-acetyltransferase [Candidatus Kapabacteria bacterium]
MLIRILDEHDAEPYFHLRRASLIESPLAFGSSVADDRASTLDAVREMLGRAPDAVVIGAFVPELAGAVGLIRNHQVKSSHRAFIWGMYVSPGHRGGGIGPRLLKAALAHARSLPGVSTVHLSVTEAAAGARRIYERAGFQVWGSEPDALRHEGRSLTEHHMALRLDGRN